MTTSMEERAYPPLPEPLEGCALRGDVERVGVEAAPAAAAAAAATMPPRQLAARRRRLHPVPRALAGERGADQNPEPRRRELGHRLRFMGRLPLGAGA